MSKLRLSPIQRRVVLHLRHVSSDDEGRALVAADAKPTHIERLVATGHVAYVDAARSKVCLTETGQQLAALLADDDVQT